MERIASKSGMTISDIMEQGRQAGHRKTYFKETVDKSEAIGNVKPKSPISDPRISPFASRPTGGLKIDPLAGFRIPSPLAPLRLESGVGASIAQQTRPGRAQADADYKMAVARLESFTNANLQDPAMKSDYIKYLTDANRLASQYDFPTVVSKIGAGSEIRKYTSGIALKQNSINSKANNQLKRDIRRGIRKSGVLKKGIDKSLKTARKKLGDAHKKLDKATIANRKRDSKNQERKDLATLIGITQTAQAEVDSLEQRARREAQELLELKKQSQSSDQAKIKLKKQKDDLRHDIKMADKMDLSNAKARRSDMATAVGRHMIASLEQPTYGPTLEEDIGGVKRPREDPAVATSKRRRGMHKSLEEQAQEDASRRKLKEDIEQEQVEARLEFFARKQEKRRTKRERDVLEKASKLEEWTLSEFQSDMGLHLVPGDKKFMESMKKLTKQVDIPEEEAKRQSAQEWQTQLTTNTQKLKDLKQKGEQAHKAYQKIVGKQPGFTKKEREILLTDIFPYAEKQELPSYQRAKLANAFVGDMKKIWPDAGWTKFEPDSSHRFGTMTSIEMRQLLAQTRDHKAKLTPETNLLLLKMMGYPKETQDKIRDQINSVSKALGHLQEEAMDTQKLISQAKAGKTARKKIDAKAKKEAEKSKVQKLKSRSRTPEVAPRSASPRSASPHARAKSPRRARSASPTPKKPKPTPKPKRPRSRAETVSSKRQKLQKRKGRVPVGTPGPFG